MKNLDRPVPLRTVPCGTVPEVVFLVGPTGSGKTELSLLLAKRLGGEIISADSMLVYRGMDIGTAKPAPAEQRKVRHHLIDLVSPRSYFSVYLHRQRAFEAIQQILKRGKIPLIVGGSGLYVNAIWKGLSNIPGQGRKIYAPRGGNLYERLRRLDPALANRIHPHDQRRILRALAIAKSSGKVPSEWYGRRESLTDLGYSPRVFGITRDREEIYERINQRVKTMFRQGLIREVKRLKRTGFSKTSKQALGYREVLEFLKKGGDSSPKEALIPLIQKRTRQFAKRQLTWFRREKEIQLIPWGKGESASQVCDKVMKELKS